MSQIVAFLKCLPILLGLYKSIEAAIEKYELDETVSQHLAQVKNAVDTSDPSKLNALFNVVPNGTGSTDTAH